MSETLSAIVSPVRGGRNQPALFVGLAGDSPNDPPARLSLSGLDRVDLGRSERRTFARSKIDGADLLALGLVDARMSGKHGRITRVGGAWVLEDLGSKNGVTVNNSRISRHTLSDRDVIVVGHTALVFRTIGGEAGDLEELPAGLAGLVTLAPALANRFSELGAASGSTVPIEITGESGTGKELVARAVHKLSRRTGNSAAVNCGAIAPNLVEAELFGHRKGAFTGAGDERMGLIRSADGGTLFLDEIGELPLAAQASLLRVLQEHEVLPIGSDRPVKVDLRVVTATHRSIDAEVAANRFRGDLRARLMGVSVELPSLRDRREDLGPLITALLTRLAPGRAVHFAADAVSALYAHEWPLNIRELERALAAALAVARDRIELTHLPLSVRSPQPASAIAATTGPSPAVVPQDEDKLRELLVAAIARHDGNLAAVARELGKDRTQIRRWMKRFGLSRADDSD